jgi:hypothetical protein
MNETIGNELVFTSSASKVKNFFLKKQTRQMSRVHVSRPWEEKSSGTGSGGAAEGGT